jgi:Holliday junction resolvasome RuvABC ATP-dependent DNA helicase subunit|tara:strand:+ start:5802 stop:6734 length:933 start_codon:yes stop_codon:yes gene_type:complete
MNNKDYFPDLVGQHAVKKKLGFYLEAFNKTEMCPFLNLIGAKGLGKTEFAKAFARNLRNKDGDKRSFLELNCSTIKNNEQFFEQIFMPLVSDNEITILFDECHALPLDLTMAFLTIFNTEKNSRKNFEWNEATFEFNFKKQTFIFATTESDKMFPPLKDRLTTIDFEPYSSEELGEIIKLCTPDVIFADGVIDKIAPTVRNNARSAVKRAKEISLYCGATEKAYFNELDFNELADHVGILPLGISYTEKQILSALREGSCTLTGLSAKLGLSKTAVQRDHELYLLNKNLIEIDGKRKITSQGLEICKSFA